MSHKQSRTSIGNLQWRRTSVDEMLRRVEPLLPRIHASLPFDISFTDTLGIPVHVIMRLSELQEARLEPLKEWGEMEFLTIQKGKGATPEESRLSCIMEAVEHYSGAYYPVEGKTVEGAFDELGYGAVDPRDFFIPKGVSFSPDKRLTWLRGSDLVSGSQILVPLEFILIDFPDSAYPFEGFQSTRMGFFVSNGLSAGANLDDALIAGICEVAERDEQYRLAHGTEPWPRAIDFRGDDHFDAFEQLFREKGLDLKTFYSDKVPGVYTAFATSFDPYCRTLFQGSAAALDLRIALHQAILELAQQRAWVFFYHYRTHRQYLPIVRYIREHTHPASLAPDVPHSHWTRRADAPIPLGEIQPFPSDLDSLVRNFAPHHRIAAFDLTHPDLQIPVVRVIASGLQNGYFQYQPVTTFPAIEVRD
jgi:ribosomal protein S12 methylthiotransferase accessory factor